MPEDLHDNSRGHILNKQERCLRVSQVMEAALRNSSAIK